MRGGQSHSKLSQLTRNQHALVHQMVLVMARQEAGPRETQPNMIKEIGKQLQKAKRPSRKTGTVTALKRVNLCTFSQGKMKKGDIADDEDDDAVRTSVVLQD